MPCLLDACLFVSSAWVLALPQTCRASPCASYLQVSKANRERIATQPTRQRAPPPRPGASVRERALQFAKHSVPKPSSFKGRPAGGSLGRSASGPAAAAAAAVEHVDATGGELPAGAPADEGGITEPAHAAGAVAGAVELLDGKLGAMTLAEDGEAPPAHGQSEQATAAANSLEM